MIHCKYIDEKLRRRKGIYADNYLEMFLADQIFDINNLLDERSKIIGLIDLSKQVAKR